VKHKDTDKPAAIKALIAIVINALVLALSISCIFPLIWMLYSSFKTNQEFSLNIIKLPSQLRLDNYITAIKNGNLILPFWNSIFNGVISVVLVILLGFLIAFCLARYNFRGRNFIYVILLFGMLVPIHGLLVPLFIQFNMLGLLDKHFTLIPPYIAFGLPMAVFLFESFLKSTPIAVEEAAFIDGSSLFTVIFRIVMPICKPVIATAIILTFLNSWNEFPFALVLLRSPKMMTVPLALANFNGQYTMNYPQLLSAMVIAVLPVIIVYLAFSKSIIQGMTSGSVKG
jgi:raffinose/stachyose/melibiose transport system permease protein